MSTDNGYHPPGPKNAGTESQRTQGMPFSVVTLRRNGIRLTNAEFAEARPAVGLLTISDWPHGSVAKRAIRQAQLHKAGSSGELVIQPLFDPVIVKADKNGLLLMGWEVRPIDGKGVEYVQAWMCQPAF